MEIEQRTPLKRVRTLESQRRVKLRCIDYQDACDTAGAIIDAQCSNSPCGDYSPVKNRIVVEWADMLTLQNKAGRNEGLMHG